MKKSDKNSIAIVGMACHYPGATKLANFWENILSQRCQFRDIPKERLSEEYINLNPKALDQTYCQKGAFIDGFQFDLLKHRVPKSTFESTDFVHWLALKVALEALEDAGLSKLPKETSGVIIGNTLTGEQTRAESMRLRWPYVKKVLKASIAKKSMKGLNLDEFLQTTEAIYKSVFAPITEDTLAGSLSNTIAGRICNYLDFNGGGFTIDGACSSSMLAIANAANVLKHREMDLVLVGGVDISLDTLELVGFAKTGAITRTEMRVYDQRASGFIPGEGCGFVVLKRLEDALADNNDIYAVLNGWGISSDGKGGLTAPKSSGQCKAILRAYDQVDYKISQLDFIEGHGTGTPVGDRAELQSIAEAMSIISPEHNKRQCGMTSLKSLIGHTKAASGIGAFIKAAIAVNQRILPPTFNCNKPSKVFQEEASTVFPLQNGKIKKPNDILRAGVSGMGFGGINCHITLESGPKKLEKISSTFSESSLLASSQGSEVILISAHNDQELRELIVQLKNVAKGISIGELPDLSQYYLENLKNAPLRVGVVVNDPWDIEIKLNLLLERLRSSSLGPGEYFLDQENGFVFGNQVKKTKIGFLFPGQGSQNLNMTEKLVMRHKWAEHLIGKTDKIFNERHNSSLSEFVFRNIDNTFDPLKVAQWKEDLTKTERAQPAICMSSAIWLEKIKFLGIKPDGVAGHSLGELTALYASGQFDFEQLIRLASVRGHAMMSKDQQGSMASLACGKEQALKIISKIDEYVTIANINTPTQTVISGDIAGIEIACHFAKELGINAVPLAVSNAFHSKLVAKAADEFYQDAPIQSVFQNNSIKLFSGLDGQVLTDGQCLREYISKQIVSPVDYITLVKEMDKHYDILLEVGPGSVLSNLTKHTLGEQANIFHLESNSNDLNGLNEFIAAYYALGGEIKVSKINEDRLIRKFVPANQRIFFTNPCEKPLKFDESLINQNVPSVGRLENLLGQFSGIPEKELNLYLQKRSEFLGDVVKADFHSLKSFFSSHLPSNLDPLALSQEKSPSEVIPSNLDNRTMNIKEKVFRVIADKTGFPISSLKLEFKLLDDLNLDSIKSSELIYELSQFFEVEIEGNPSDYANISLMELVQIFTVKKNQLTQGNDLKEELLSLLEKKYGYPIDSLNMDLKLLDDLNLDSIKASELLVDLAGKSNIPMDADFSQYANSTLQEIVDYFESAKLLSSKNTTPQPSAAYPSWVRSFHTSWIEEPLSSIQSKMKEGFYLLLFDEKNQDLALSLQTILDSYGCKTKICSFENISEIKETYDYVIALTSPISRDEPSESSIRLSITQITKLFSKQFYKDRQGKFISLVIKTSTKKQELNHQPLTALLSSFYLDNPSWQVKNIELNLNDSNKVYSVVRQELNSEILFQSVKYDKNMNRFVQKIKMMNQESFTDRYINWSSNDLVLVTGGAKGITAQCIIGLAKKHPVSFALVGRTPQPPKEEKGHEINQTLETLSSFCKTVSYHSCDVTDRDQVDKLFDQIRTTHNKNITGFIHGSAINSPGELDKVSYKDALDEVSPKVIGAINILKHLEKNPPKLILGFSSIIGVTGMMKNGWYGYSNEFLNHLLKNFSERFPQTQSTSLAYSVWDEVGMGVRLGSTTYLASLGIDAISVEKGIKHFLQVFDKDPKHQEIIISARAKGLSTFIPYEAKTRRKDRFTESIEFYQPKIELITKTHLTKEKDSYVIDHNWRGSLLFPTVMGLEAMAQNVKYLLGNDNGFTKISQIKLERPIIVNETTGSIIEIRTMILEHEEYSVLRKIKVSIRSEQTGFKVDHFSAVFEETELNSSEKISVKKFDKSLNINPSEDLYYPLFLFQGPMYQRIQKIFELRDDYCLMQTLVGESNSYTLGDPFVRDTYLQSGQIPIPQDICLPKYIETIERFPIEVKVGEVLWCEVQKYEHTKDEVKANITVYSQDGFVIERMSGCINQIIDHKPTQPQSLDLIDPTMRDHAILDKALNDMGKEFSFNAPTIWVQHYENFKSYNKEERHSLIEKDLNKFSSEFHSEKYKVIWQSNGKPLFSAEHTPDIPLSISHTGDLCLASTGKLQQGCDVEQIREKDTKGWLSLFGKEYEGTLSQLQSQGDSTSIAGTRIWSVLEAYYKATQVKKTQLKILQRKNQCVLFSDKEEQVYLISFPIQLTKNSQKIFSFVVERPKQEEKLDSAISKSSIKLEGNKFTHSFETTFLDSRGLGGKVYFTNIPVWMGKLRELSLKPIASQIVKDMTSGEWAMVTNDSSLKVKNFATSFDPIVGEIYLDQSQTNFDESYFYIAFKWYKVNPKNQKQLIATSHISITWVRVEGHGLVKKAPLPPYLLEYISSLPRTNIQEHSPKLITLKPLFSLSIGKRKEFLLESLVFQTSIVDSNLVGNIYYSHYYSWQSRVLDKFLFQLVPEIFSNIDQKREFVCDRSEVNHLQEAMPFDKVEVCMYLEKLYEEGFGFYFEFFCIDGSGERKKLAYGHQRAIWCDTSNAVNQMMPSLMPERILEYLKQLNSEKE